MRDVLFRVSCRAFEILVLLAVVWATVVLGGVLGWGWAGPFGLLATAFCFWTGLRRCAIRGGRSDVCSPKGRRSRC